MPDALLRLAELCAERGWLISPTPPPRSGGLQVVAGDVLIIAPIPGHHPEDAAALILEVLEPRAAREGASSA